ncbi:hypothetical protein [Clostridium estertheticum]|uniref:hypothetical protein n=1 Tax=Clostridium estertheticum TaxID=238834 RepID=UPI001C7CD6C4|nr:hypothetical protein [Clostridium estertheticum]MBX4263076.1 hypothetical protein [Clostridium estertheticum]MBX4271146.1 hypothetical protein [Clostridium estertheticum]WLC78380.1 hypothetical protein KTC98_14195 [Clostridium estertheticum]WLC89397.1 hypothetical protein KTC95_03990 [Clostridium estertheticum]
MKRKHILKSLTLLSIIAILTGCGEKTTAGTTSSSTKAVAKSINEAGGKNTSNVRPANRDEVDSGSTEESDRKNYPYIFKDGTLSMELLSSMTAESKTAMNKQCKETYDASHNNAIVDKQVNDKYNADTKKQEAEKKLAEAHAGVTRKKCIESFKQSDQGITGLYDVQVGNIQNTEYPMYCLSEYYKKKYDSDVRWSKVQGSSIVSDTELMYIVFVPDGTARNITIELDTDYNFKFKSDEENGYYKKFPIKK